jgi:CheY-like chemotaxis protein
VAADGREALEVFRRRQKEIRCVVLDLSMPHMDGEETLAALREIAPGVPVLLSSGYGEHEVGGRLRGSPPSDFIQKPYKTKRLAEKLRSVLSQGAGGFE